MEKLVDTEAACLWTGRPRSTLYRWASEGRIKQYGGKGKGRALWDLGELPMHIDGEEMPPPPPLPGPTDQRLKSIASIAQALAMMNMEQDS